MSISKWEFNTDYVIGERVKYKGNLYKCLQNHNSGVFNTPDLYLGLLWSNNLKLMDNDHVVYIWRPGSFYYNKDKVEFDNKVYICIANHISTPFTSPRTLVKWKIL